MTHRGLKLNPPEVQEPRAASHGSVGRPLKHDSAELHVQGAAAYIDDLPEPRGTLHVAPGYANISAGKFKNLDLTEVAASDGVVAVLTSADIPGVNDCSPALGDDLILSPDVITFHGQVLFAVVAETREQARMAARKAHIEVADQVPHVTVADGKAAQSSVLPDYSFLRGDPNTEIKSSPISIRDSFHVGGQEHFYLEGQVAMAVPGDGAEMLVYSSSQHPSEVQHTVAKMLAVPDAAITCECRRMGGGFGGKESQAAQWAALAALAAHKTGKPAKLRLDRDDDMRLTGKRHDFDVTWKAGFSDDGVLQAVDVNLAARCGNSADLSTGVVDRAMFHADSSYYYPHVRIHSERIRTHTVSNTAFRGFGGPQGMLFAERMMDAIAFHLGKDPLDVRKANFYGEGRDITPYGMQVTDNILPDVIERLEKTSDYRARREQVRAFNKANPYLRKGIALTPVKFGISFTLKHLNQAGALVNVFADGSVQINHGGTEMGQGLYIKVAQIVADVFGVDIDRVKITSTRTDKVPNASPTAASSGTDLNGMAASIAATTIRDRMAELAARLYQCQTAEVVFAKNHVQAGESKVAFSELARLSVLERVSLSSTGYYATPNITWERETATGQPFLYFAYGAACSEVTIDTLTGEMKVDRVDILHDVGRSLNDAIDIGQIEGGFVQGMGWLTTEELVYDDKGILRTHAPSTYKIPTAFDLPEDFRVELMPSEGNQADTIHKSKAVGEPPVMLAISVYSAIFDAIASMAKPGTKTLPPLNAPATPEAILKAITALREERRV
ncbi:MAG: xanthine dehydrogenase molybdopterin binding subunit [Kordiimonadaceae bacterium]|nr:xanthine dehydrogenase molybdopterin binding subunit [Kordiimonadaceae bacterium]MBO6567468.1 xanthine dehydrogenase molybdopterin binding subunit [Kordiimonadaceae bacterium]MBO6963318.1 xanthine dehydrogenase molybdopterin binding subunit [Kordiimonadaceae bacterium]